MRKIKREIRAVILDFGELTGKEQILVVEARAARERAQAPYSGYCVGVAIESVMGRVYTGCNVERCTFTQTTHAEQNAVDTMVRVEGPYAKIRKVVLVAAPAGNFISLPPVVLGDSIQWIDQVPVPCGHCLQIIWENCDGNPNVELIALASNGEVVKTTIGDAFPMRFGPEDVLGAHAKL